MRDRGALAHLAVLAALAGIVAVQVPALIPTLAGLWVLAALGYGLVALHAEARPLGGGPSRFEALLAGPDEPPDRPADLRECEQLVAAGTYNPRSFDHRLRPLLRALVHHRARERTGIDPAADPAAARRVLDPELETLIGPASAEELYGRALTTADLERIVTRIEAL